MKLSNTPEFIFGRRGEIVQHSFLLECGFTGFDQSGTANGKAPVLQSHSANMIAPDALMIRRWAFFSEYKTKTKQFMWDGGSREAREAGYRIMSPGAAHGIERRAFIDYTKANTKLPVLLWFLCEETGCMHGASLFQLGEPYLSWKPEMHDMVNWPINKMWPIVEFDQHRLTKFLRNPKPIDRMPAVELRRQMLLWLQPRQLEFDTFHEHFLAYLELYWHGVDTDPTLDQLLKRRLHHG